MCLSRCPSWPLALIVFAVASALPPPAAADAAATAGDIGEDGDPTAEIRRWQAQLPAGDEFAAHELGDAIERVTIELPAADRYRDTLAALYRSRDHRPLWRDGAAVVTLRAAIDGLEADGLRPASLPLARAGLASAASRDAARRDVWLTATLLSLLDALHHGQADPRGLRAPAAQPLRYRHPDATDVSALAERIADGDIAEAIDEARPSSALYRRLRAALARERERLADGEPARLPDGPTLEAGSGGERVRALRQRLAALGEFDGPSDAPGGESRWDRGLSRAVRTFQSRNGLEVDGRVGGATVAAINRSVADRIDALRVNLERARWFARAIGDRDRVVVNVAAFELTVHLDGEIALVSPVVVGKPTRATPVFVGLLDEVVLDPTWTVPKSIVADSLFERARNDPHGFAAEGFRLRDVAGRYRSPLDIDWDTMTLERFHFDVVQMPGPANALGSVKFRFDNPYSVYLHDSPARALFDEPRRAFSHGCIRVGEPGKLERLLLGRRGGLDSMAIASLRAASDDVPIELLDPLPVGLLYWTADVDERGRPRILPDLYGRDAAVLDALDGRAAS